MARYAMVIDTKTCIGCGDMSGGGPTFPEFDRSCSSADDCVIVVHTTDCCGNSVAWGINESEVERFNEAEAICDSQWPGCGCPAGPTVADDGNSVMDLSEIAVRCDSDTCHTYVP